MKGNAQLGSRTERRKTQIVICYAIMRSDSLDKYTNRNHCERGCVQNDSVCAKRWSIKNWKKRSAGDGV